MTSLSIFSANTEAARTMSSNDIACVTQKQHSHVLRDIRAMLDALKDDPKLDHQFREDKDARGYTAAFHLDQELTLTLVAGYDAKLRHAVVKRWKDLETGRAVPMMAVPAQDNGPSLTDASNSLIAMHSAGVISKRAAADLYRAAMLSKYHGASVLMAASKATPKAKAMPAPTQATLTNGESVPYGFRAAGTKSATDLLRDHGVSAQAKALYDAMEKQNMVTTRYELTVDQPGYRVLIGDGLQYGQNVMLFESKRSNPYFYHDKFAALLKRVGLLVDATPKPTASERALRDYKNIVKDAWNTYGCETSESVNRDGIHTPYLTRSSLIQYLTIELGKPEKTAQNFATPRSYAMRALFKDGFLQNHQNGWLIFDGDSI